MVGASTSRLIEISCFIGLYTAMPQEQVIQQHPRSDTSTGSLYFPDAPRKVVCSESKRILCLLRFPTFALFTCFTSPFVSSGWSSPMLPDFVPLR